MVATTPRGGIPGTATPITANVPPIAAEPVAERRIGITGGALRIPN